MQILASSIVRSLLPHRQQAAIIPESAENDRDGARGREGEVSLGKRIATHAITVPNDAGETVSAFQDTVYRKRDPTP